MTYRKLYNLWGIPVGLLWASLGCEVHSQVFSGSSQTFCWIYNDAQEHVKYLTKMLNNR